ncbi:putative ABC transport system permease protein [Zunongwangia mangrovi]|uniref:Putative ABC transport system permease protein n=1 Tax=Zunongwangia mangrovi TaxID=1334022 RepID=A0A1I1GBI2_9FLAO|nr:ABC transporter permease [Zunongwangia mangrovi]SFC09069.1 putative ABC transport system permease protein [Zunongwangia mangrovi]
MFALLRENISIAFDSIKGQLLRTILTVLIIAIGITALVGILSAVGALENTISGNFASMGANTFNIQRYNYTSQRGNEINKVNPVITYREVKTFQDKYQYPLTTTAISFTGTSSAEIKWENEKTDPEINVLGINENYLTNSGLEIETGRNFNYFDIQNNNNVAIIGADFAKNNGLFKGASPIDKTISVRGAKFKVIGVLESKGSTFGNNEDLRVLIPLQHARSIFSSPGINYNLSIKVENKEALDAAQDEAILTFRNIRKLSPVEKDNFGIERSDSLLNEIAEMSSVLNLAAWIISLVTIFGSSIALMNIMLVSVTERTREIGVRKALGAKKNTIAAQFFMETLIIGQFGGVLGIILGILIGMAVSAGVGFDFTTPWLAMFWAVVVTLLTALFSGLYPAIKASKQDPIESLRYE